MKRAAAALLALAAVATASATRATAVVDTPVSAPESAGLRSVSYPVVDAHGKALRQQGWRVSEFAGNCCEVLLGATPDGKLMEFGGSRFYVSDDRGEHWSHVNNPNALQSGEGAMAVAPNGDLVGIDWEGLGADEVIAFKRSAATGSWSVVPVPLHTPFFDRPWIGVAPGPITIGGQQCPYATVVSGGDFRSEVRLLSCDGLTYVPSNDTVDRQRTQALRAPLPYAEVPPSTSLPVTGGEA